MPIRRVLALLVGASLPLLMSSAALAHAVLQPGNAPAGEATEFQVLIPHGCAPGEPPPPPGTEVADTTLVSVEIPDGVTVEGAEEVDGFTLEVTDTEITWSDGVLENEDPGEFFFTAVLDGDNPFARIVGWRDDFRQASPESYGQYAEKFPELADIPTFGGFKDGTFVSESSN